MRTTLAFAFAALLLAACGRDGPRAAADATGARAVDRSSPEVVLEQAHRALAAGDWGALEPLLTADGRARLEADLRAWHDVLTDPATGPRAAARLPAPADAAGRAVVRRAIADADPAALLWLLALADPRPALPPLPPAPRPPDAARAELTYPARGAERRRVVLSRDRDGWRIDRLQL